MPGTMKLFWGDRSRLPYKTNAVAQNTAWVQIKGLQMMKYHKTEQICRSVAKQTRISILVNIISQSKTEICTCRPDKMNYEIGEENVRGKGMGGPTPFLSFVFSSHFSLSCYNFSS